jgi:hypothetical protein
MNNAYLMRKSTVKPIEEYSGLIFSRIVYDNDFPIMHLMSVSEALRQRKWDRLKIMRLTENATRTLERMSEE